MRVLRRAEITRRRRMVKARPRPGGIHRHSRGAILAQPKALSESPREPDRGAASRRGPAEGTNISDLEQRPHSYGCVSRHALIERGVQFWERVTGFAHRPDDLERTHRV